MSRHTIHRCDRCGEETLPNHPIIKFIYHPGSKSESLTDLCIDCADDFRYWLSKSPERCQ